MLKKYILKNIFVGLIIVWSAITTFAQTNEFTYQGKLTDTGTPQLTYQMQFKLFDVLAGGAQVGTTITNPSVTVSSGIFTVNLDFGVLAFDGADRFLEIAVKRNTSDPFTVLTPRQKLTSAPYSIRALIAGQTNLALDSNKLGGIDANQYVTTASVGNSFIKNGTTLQNGNFNISGGGIIGDSLGIGTTPNSGYKLDVNGNARFSIANGRTINFASPNAETGMTIIGTNRADLRFNDSTLKLVVGSGNGVPPSTNGITIDTVGDVSIGNVGANFSKFAVASSLQNAVEGSSIDSAGIFGKSVNGNGVYGESSGNGLNSYAGFFNGRTHVGNLEVQALGTAGATAVCYNALRLLAACSSSLRYKKDVKSFNEGLSFINQLRPIAYKWKADDMPDTGFGAEDVAKINPLFVTFNDKGEVEGVKYDRLSVVFVNAFKEQQVQIEQQQKQLEQQRLQIADLKKLICLEHSDAAFCLEK